MQDAVKSGWYPVKDREKAYYHYAQTQLQIYQDLNIKLHILNLIGKTISEK